ncbi:hypothetical protein QBC33DRAFT_554154 [Phialemonium atrogriseum]|uniref:Uncharacterized protein n=1 Tax=Phialemonium atrogriseum TaxID=1093897 RepID=A0AAJ0FRX3_9PEZI|nr:uncharacterized protein QBC33DRAFT_554154 [Phialemonium atrogriseum]KAK1772708.1 hypothetical protein QBC33DRAFT_554154 [Phialemonium atrogriseum]
MATTAALRRDARQPRRDGIKDRGNGPNARERRTRHWRCGSSESEETFLSSESSIWLASPLRTPSPPSVVYAPADAARRVSQDANFDTPFPTPPPTPPPLPTDASTTTQDNPPPLSTTSSKPIPTPRSPQLTSNLPSPTTTTTTTTPPPPTPLPFPLQPRYSPPHRNPTPPGLPSYVPAGPAPARRPIRRPGLLLLPPQTPPAQQQQQQRLEQPQPWYPPRSAHALMRHHPYLAAAAAGGRPGWIDGRGGVVKGEGGGEGRDRDRVGAGIGDVGGVAGHAEGEDEDGWSVGGGSSSWVGWRVCCCWWDDGDGGAGEGVFWG